jgi:hypothetical protein
MTAPIIVRGLVRCSSQAGVCRVRFVAHACRRYWTLRVDP